MFAVSGMSLGLIEGGSIVFVFHMWGSVAMPIIQTAYFMFGIGALAAPLLSQPFLLVTHPGDLMDGLEIGYRAAKSHEHLHDQGMECNLVVPYSVLAGLMLVNAVLMFLVWCWSPETPEHPSRIQVPKEGSVVGMQEKTRSTVWKAVVVMLHLLVVHLYFGVYVGLASYLSSFVVTSDLNLSKTEGAHMTTMFWSTFTFAKLVALAYTPWIGNRNSVLLGLSVMLTGSILLVLFAETSESLVWLAVALIGIGLSSIYACMLRYLENFFPVTSTIGSLTSVAGVLGEFTFPALISLFIDSTPIVVVWVVAASSVAMSALFPLIILLCNTKLKA